MARWLALAAGASLSLAPRAAPAYVCTRVQDVNGEETGSALWWADRLVTYALFDAGTADVGGDVELDVLRASFRPWGRVIDAGGNLVGSPPQEDISPFRTTDLVFDEAETTSSRDGLGYDFLHPLENENLLVFRDDGWPNFGAGSVIALTTTTYNAISGEILDADIEFNSSGFNFTVSDFPGPLDTDLMNTAVHEIGHLLGLSHSPLAAATMAARADTGETSKRVLHRDDRNAIVFRYPEGQANGVCDPGLPGCTCPPPDAAEVAVQVTGSAYDDGLTPRDGCRGVGGAGAWAAAFVIAAWSVARVRRRA